MFYHFDAVNGFILNNSAYVVILAAIKQDDKEIHIKLNN